MIIALAIAYDDGDFAVHYAKAKTLDSAQRWCAERRENMERQGTECSVAVINTDHAHEIADCGDSDAADG